MTNLKDVFGFNEYCGPGVISAITGVSTDRAAAVISVLTGGRKVIKGVQTNTLLEAFDRLGYNQKLIPLYASLLGGVLVQIAKQQTDGTFLVAVKDHVVAVELNKGQIWFCDNHTKQPINAATSARLTQRVESVWQIIPRAKVEAPPPLPPKPKAIERSEIGSRIAVVVSNNGIFVDRVTEYDNGEESKSQIGMVKFKDGAEFSQIVNTIMEAFEGADDDK